MEYHLVLYPTTLIDYKYIATLITDTSIIITENTLDDIPVDSKNVYVIITPSSNSTYIDKINKHVYKYIHKIEDIKNPTTKIPSWIGMNQYCKDNGRLVPMNDTLYRTTLYVIPYSKSYMSEEIEYLELLENHLEDGIFRPDRTGTGTLSLFKAHQLIFDISKSFPLITTKKVFFKGVAEELFFFLSGKTDVKLLQDKDVHIWDGNSSREYLDSIGQSHREVGDLGKFYGFQWRHWGAEYKDFHTNYEGKGFDQIAMVVDTIKRDPYSRRILLSAWNPSDLKEMALPPCHILYQFYVDVEKKQLSCSMYQRSADLFLGVPFNIASTALLTTLIARTCDLTPGEITLTFGDSHVYLNHVDAVIQQIKRTPYPFPKLVVKNKKDKLEEYNMGDLELIDYKSHEKITAKMAV